MSSEQMHTFCECCGRDRLATRQAFSHTAHILATVFMCGVWLPFWIALAIAHHFTPFRCTRCGTEAR